jgi:16S rRNA (adenine1518-N6/adenine1519-N6)-dimethyltransferase
VTDDADDGAGVRLLGASDVRRLAAELDLRPTKQRGQNFVVDANTVRRVVRAAGVDTDDTVLEVGPGLGSLTLALLESVRQVTAIEIDAALARALPETLARYAPARAADVAVVHADAMRVAAADLPGPAPTALVANLPYNVAVPVLLHLLETFDSLRHGLVMVQAEVAERLTASPGSRRYGVPSVKTAWYAATRPAGRVGRQVFWPPPRVESGLVAWTRRDPPSSGAGRRRVFAVVDAAFAQRRKMLRSALAELAGGVAAAESALRAAGVSPSDRGERLDLAAFVRIADALEA